MKASTTFLFFIVIVTLNYCFNQDVNWAKDISTPNSTESNNINSVAISNGICYSIGTSQGDFNIGTTTNPIYIQNSDFFILKTDLLGNYIGHINYSNTNTTFMPYQFRIDVDSVNNVYFAARFAGNFDADPGPGTVFHNTTMNSTFGIIIVKLDSLGNHVWSSSVADQSTQYQVTDIDVDNDLNVAVAGTFSGYYSDFDPGIGEYHLDEIAYQLNGFVLKLKEDGSFKWVKQLPFDVTSTVYEIEHGKSNNLYAVGQCQGHLTDTSGIFNLYPPVTNGSTGILLKFDTLGNYCWAYSPTNTDYQNYSEFLNLQLDNHENIILAGTFTNNIDLLQEPNDTLIINGSSDILIEKIDSLGTVIWGKRFGNNSFINNPSKLVVDKNDTIYLSTSITDFYFHGSQIQDSVFCNDYDLTFVKFAPTGDMISYNKFGGSNGQYNYGLAIDDSSNLYVGGSYYTEIDIPPYYFVNTTAWHTGFLLRFKFTEPTTNLIINEIAPIVFLAHPNPTANEIEIELNNLNDECSVFVYSSEGRLISSHITNDSKFNIDLSKEESGVYLIQIQSDNWSSTLRVNKIDY